MNAPLCSCDTYGGSGMRNTCSTAGELKQTISSLRAQVAELKCRLEIDEDGWDGIACRDETIKVQDVKIAELKAENERLKTTPAHKREDLRCVASDLAHQCRGVESERDEFKARYERLKPRHEAYVKMIGELLAVLHADGGHYQYEHGTEKAVEDAITKHYELTRQLAEYKAQSRCAISPMEGDKR